jgi:hypothetical protein
MMYFLPVVMFFAIQQAGEIARLKTKSARIDEETARMTEESVRRSEEEVRQSQELNRLQDEIDKIRLKTIRLKPSPCRRLHLPTGSERAMKGNLSREADSAGKVSRVNDSLITHSYAGARSLIAYTIHPSLNHFGLYLAFNRLSLAAFCVLSSLGVVLRTFENSSESMTRYRRHQPALILHANKP